MFFSTIRSALVPVLAAFVYCLSITAGLAQSSFSGTQPLSMDKAFHLTASQTDNNGIRLKWTIAPGYYLYENHFSLQAGQADIAMPPPEGDRQEKDDPTFGLTTIFYDHVAIIIPLTNSADGQNLQITYQGCQDGGICYPPVTKTINPVTLAITAAGSGLPYAFARKQQNSEETPQANGITIAADSGNMVNSLLHDGGLPLLLGSFLLFGIALAFTPCVFPMYPILAGTIIRQQENVTVWRSFSLSVAYVLAMACAFGLLGIVAAWSGQNLQMALQSPWAIGAVAALFAVLSLSMFGFFELQLPSAWVNAINRTGAGSTRGSHSSAALLGFTSALIVGPCVTAPLAGALIYIAQTGNMAIGAASLFALGLGNGIPLILFGTLGPKALPKAGAWMNRVRQAFGFVFIAVAIWMLSRLVLPIVTMALWTVLTISIATWLGAFDSLSPESSGRRRAAKATGLAVALYGIILAVGAASGGNDPLRPLGHLIAQSSNNAPKAGRPAFQNINTQAELNNALAQAGNKPSLLYVTADWCATCVIIDRHVLQDRQIQNLLAGFNLIKLDVSANSPAQQEIMRALEVAGPPTMIFVNAQGHEISGTRLIGDITPSCLAKAIAATQAAQ